MDWNKLKHILNMIAKKFNSNSLVPSLSNECHCISKTAEIFNTPGPHPRKKLSEYFEWYKCPDWVDIFNSRTLSSIKHTKNQLLHPVALDFNLSILYMVINPDLGSIWILKHLEAKCVKARCRWGSLTVTHSWAPLSQSLLWLRSAGSCCMKFSRLTHCDAYFWPVYLQVSLRF